MRPQREAMLQPDDLPRPKRDHTRVARGVRSNGAFFAKGVGRLAAHKLASLLCVTSIPRKHTQKPVEATIDWDEVEKRETLDQLEDTDAVVVKEVERAAGVNHETTIRLQNLRESWSPASRQRFQQEVASFQPPPVVFQFDEAKLLGPPILKALTARDVQTAGEKARADEFECKLVRRNT